MPETRLFEGKYFGTERFDRTPAGKVHTVSAVGLIHADYMDEVVETIRFENKLKYGM